MGGEGNELRKKWGGAQGRVVKRDPMKRAALQNPLGKYPSPSSNLFRPLPLSVLLILDSNQFQIELGTPGSKVEKIGILIDMS